MEVDLVISNENKANILTRIEAILAMRPRGSDVVFPLSKVAIKATDVDVFFSEEFQADLCANFKFKKVRKYNHLVFLIK